MLTYLYTLTYFTHTLTHTHTHTRRPFSNTAAHDNMDLLFIDPQMYEDIARSAHEAIIQARRSRSSTTFSPATSSVAVTPANSSRYAHDGNKASSSNPTNLDYNLSARDHDGHAHAPEQPWSSGTGIECTPREGYVIPLSTSKGLTARSREPDNEADVHIRHTYTELCSPDGGNNTNYVIHADFVRPPRQSPQGQFGATKYYVA